MTQGRQRTITPLFLGPGFAAPGLRLAAPPAAEELEEERPIFILIPRSFGQMLFHTIIVSRAREVPVVVEQVVPAGASGTITVGLPAGRFDIQRFFTEAGDGSVSYSIEVQSAGQFAVPSHRVTGGAREFGRYWEKTQQVIIRYTNTDPANAALLQLSWISVQVDTAKWTAYRDNLIAWSKIIGVQE
jgi:hypothetical protein